MFAYMTDIHYITIKKTYGIWLYPRKFRQADGREPAV